MGYNSYECVRCYKLYFGSAVEGLWNLLDNMYGSVIIHPWPVYVIVCNAAQLL
jgi:hypothetical protein